MILIFKKNISKFKTITVYTEQISRYAIIQFVFKMCILFFKQSQVQTYNIAIT